MKSNQLLPSHSPCVCTQLLSRVQLFVTPMDCNLPGFSVHGFFHARILEQVAISSSRDLPHPGIELSLLHCLHWQEGSLPLSHLRSPSLLRLRFKFQLCHFLAVWFWGNPLISLRPSFLNSRIIESMYASVPYLFNKHLVTGKQDKYPR